MFFCYHFYVPRTLVSEPLFGAFSVYLRYFLCDNLSNYYSRLAEKGDEKQSRGRAAHNLSNLVLEGCYAPFSVTFKEGVSEIAGFSAFLSATSGASFESVDPKPLCPRTVTDRSFV